MNAIEDAGFDATLLASGAGSMGTVQMQVSLCGSEQRGWVRPGCNSYQLAPAAPPSTLTGIIAAQQ